MNRDTRYTDDTMSPDQLNAWAQVLWYFEPGTPGARRPGGFNEHLLAAWARADSRNHMRLASLWPHHGVAMGMAMHGVGGGLEALREQVQQASSRGQ